jgi:hypothetical protein
MKLFRHRRNLFLSFLFVCTGWIIAAFIPSPSATPVHAADKPQYPVESATAKPGSGYAPPQIYWLPANRHASAYGIKPICKVQGVPGTYNGETGPQIQSGFSEVPVNTINPQGWLHEFLVRQRSGLTGHPEVLSYPYNSCLWAGTIARENEQHGDNWWRYEQTAYYTDGLLKLGYLLHDSSLLRKAHEGIYYTLNHPQPNGRLGPGLFESQWPIAVFFRVLQAEWMATGKQEIIDALHRHYLSYSPEDLGTHKRNIVNLEGLLWTYGKTQDKTLLHLAEKAYALGGFELTIDKCLSADTISLHGVTYMEMAKLPAILYSYTGKKRYLDAAVNAMKKLERDHMLPDGVPSSNEFLAGKDPLQSHETCDISDYTWTLGYLLMITGEARWADLIEKAIFNAGPGAVSKDFRNLQYFSSVNQVIATGNSNHNKHAYGSTWTAYWPCHETECCAGNVHRFMPNFAARTWMKDSTGAPVAALYAPGTCKFLIGGESVTIKEETNYPFSPNIRFRFEMQKSTGFPFSFRIPLWCTNASVSINGMAYRKKLAPGTFVTINRKFKPADEIVLSLPMDPRVINWNQMGLTVERGPLLFAYAVPEKIKTDTAVYPNLLGKRSNDPGFPALDIRPAGAWNYSLGMNKEKLLKNMRVVIRNIDGYPYDPQSVPVQIRVAAVRVKEWTLVENRFTPALPAPGSSATEKMPDTITLVPYGSTRLRVAVFPITNIEP